MSLVCFRKSFVSRPSSCVDVSATMTARLSGSRPDVTVKGTTHPRPVHVAGCALGGAICSVHVRACTSFPSRARALTREEVRASLTGAGIAKRLGAETPARRSGGGRA